MNGKQGENPSCLKERKGKMGKVDIAVLIVCKCAVLMSGLPAVMSHWRAFLDSAEEDGVLRRFVCLLTSSATLSEGNECRGLVCPVVSKYNRAVCEFVEQLHLSAVYPPLFVLAD